MYRQCREWNEALLLVGYEQQDNEDIIVEESAIESYTEESSDS